MKRRDFLLLRTERGSGLVELSCERLYMRCVDTRVTGGDHDEDFDPVDGGEPPATFDERTTEQLFVGLDRDLRDVDSLRVLDRRWIAGASEELRLEFEALLASFRARGGHVEFSETPTPGSAPH